MILDNYKDSNNRLSNFFIRQNKRLGLVFGLLFILVVISLIGWSYWRKTHNQAIIIASNYWQHIDKFPNQLTMNNAHRIINSKNNYSTLILLKLASQSTNNKDFVTAEQQLQQAQVITKETNLQALIKLRLARVQLQRNNIDGALITIGQIQTQYWQVLAEDIYGDVQFLQGNLKAAQKAYNKVLQANLSPSQQALVRIKLNNLSN